MQEDHCGGLFRNTEGKCQRDFQDKVKAEECHRFHESYELKWAGERYADEYSKKASKERRVNTDSLIAKDKEILAASENLAKEIAVSCRNRNSGKQSY